MTIQFHCPNCGSLIAFDSRNAGKRARCLNCDQLFIIPQTSDEKPKIVKDLSPKENPLPGFYKAVCCKNLKIFADPDNITGFVFIAAAVSFKFLLGHTDYSFNARAIRFQAPIGFIVTLTAWGCLFWYYMRIIYVTAYDFDKLPDVSMGSIFGFIWNVLKSLWIFAACLIFVQLPCILTMKILAAYDMQIPALTYGLSLIGIFLFPMAILTATAGDDLLMAFRPDYLIKPIVRAFGPYIVMAGLFLTAWHLQLKTKAYGGLVNSNTTLIALHLVANLGVQALAVVAMRSAGLFYRHFYCFFGW